MYILPFALIFAISTASSSPLPFEEVAQYFTPTDSSLFRDWVNMVFSSPVDLADVHLPDSPAVLLGWMESKFLPSSVTDRLGNESSPAVTETIFRGLMNMMILSDLDLLDDLRMHVVKFFVPPSIDFSDAELRRMFGISFSIFVRHSEIAWNSLKIIAEESGGVMTVDVLAETLGQYGYSGQLDWFTQTFISGAVIV